jgi:hypothetical protein
MKKPRHQSRGRRGRFFFAEVEEAVMFRWGRLLLFFSQMEEAVMLFLFGGRCWLVVFFPQVKEAVGFFWHGAFSSLAKYSGVLRWG